MKRLIALALALCMIVSALPMTAFAEGTEETVETTAPQETEAPTEPVETTTAPTETEETTAPATEPTETTEPTEATEGSEETTAPTTEPEETTEPVETTGPEETTEETEEETTEETLPEALSEESGECGDNLTWTLGLDGTLSIDGTGPMWDFGTPGWAELKDSIIYLYVQDGVTTIGNNAFSGCANLTDIILPNSITSIGKYAFQNCSKLTSVSLPEGLTLLGSSAFSAAGLTSVSIPGTVTALSSYAFQDCKQLTSVTVGEGVSTIGMFAFAGCTALTSAAIGEGVTELGLNAFNGCTALTSVELPSTLTTVRDNAFANATALAHVYYAGSPSDKDKITIEAADSPRNEPLLKATWHFTKIDACGDNATWKLDKNGTLTISGSGPMWDYPDSKPGWFDQVDRITSVVIEPGITSVGDYAFKDCAKVSSVTIGKDVVSIGYSAFGSCTSLTNVYIREGVSSIGTLAFGNCTALTSIVIPEGVTTLGTGAFHMCTALVKVELPSTLATINASAFYDTALTTVYYGGSPSDKEQIDIYDTGNEALMSADWFFVKEDTIAAGSCGSNLTWTLSDTGVLQISGTGEMDDFDPAASPAPWTEYKYRITTLEVDSGVTSIGANAFYQCSELTRAALGADVTRIGTGAFPCISLMSIYFPAGLKTIDDSAFQCPNLHYINFGGSQAQKEQIAIGANNDILSTAAWSYGCEDARSGNCGDNLRWTLKDGVLSITGTGDMWDFGWYSTGRTNAPWNTMRDEITSIQLSEGITHLGDNAFTGAHKVTEVVIPDGVITVGTSTFYQLNGLTTLTIPRSVTSFPFVADCPNLSTVYYTGSPDEWRALSKSMASNTLIHKIPVTLIGIAEDQCGDNLRWSIEDGVLYIRGTGKMWDYFYTSGWTERKITPPWEARMDEITAIVIGEGVTHVGNRAFNAMSSVQWLSLPGSLASIGAYSASSNVKAVFYAGTYDEWWDVMPNIDRPNDLFNGDEKIYFQSSSPDDLSGSCGANLNWALDFDGTLTISGQGAMNGYAEKSHGWGSTAPWYDNYSHIKRIVVEPGVTSIGKDAFLGCTYVESAELADTVTTIGAEAFRGCYNLTQVNLPQGLTAIRERTFSGCSKLTNVVIPDTVTAIDAGAFNGSQAITRLELPKGLTSIGNAAFGSCKNLEAIDIPASVTYIGDSAFSYCEKLTNVVIPDTVKTMEDDIFSGCTNLTSVKLPKGLTQIGWGMFRNCTSLTDIVIPETVTVIEGHAFENCTGLTSVGIPQNVTHIEYEAFKGCANMASIYIPRSVEWIDQGAFQYCDALTDVYYTGTQNHWNRIEIDEQDNEPLLNANIHFGSAVQTPDGSYGYCGDNVIWNFTNADGVLRISGSGEMNVSGGDAPWDNTKIQKVIIEDGVTSIPAYAFDPERGESAPPSSPGGYYNSILTSVTIPNSVTHIGTGAFQRCSSLTSITIPGNVEFSPAAGPNPEHSTLIFSGCTSLTHVTFGEGIATIPSHAFYQCNNLQTITLPKTLTFVGSNAFWACDSLTDVYYGGTERNREAINIEAQGTLPLTKAAWHYSSAGPVNSLSLNRSYQILEADGEPMVIQSDISPKTLNQFLQWHVEGEDVVEILPAEDGSCTVIPSADSFGTAWVVAEIDTGNEILSARCRIDVMDQGDTDLLVKEVKLGLSNVDVELFQTEPTRIPLYIALEQNMMTYGMEQPDKPTSNGVLITSARLSGPASEFFELVPADDGSLLVVRRDVSIPTETSYAADVYVTLGNGPERNAGSVKLAIKKTTPRLKASPLSFNSFIRGQELPLNFSGGSITGAQLVSGPDWLEVDGEKLAVSLKPEATGMKGSANLELDVAVDGYSGVWGIKVPIKLSCTQPKIGLKASSVTMTNSGTSRGAELQLLSRDKKVSFEELGVTGVTGRDGYEVTSFNSTDGCFILRPNTPNAPSATYVDIHFGNSDYSVPMKVSVRKAAPQIKLAKTSISLNPSFDSAVSVDFTVIPADLDLQSLDLRITGRDLMEGEEPLNVNVDYEKGCLTVYPGPDIRPGASYTVLISTEGGKESKLTVKTLDPARSPVTASLKVSGTLDLSFPDSEVLVTPAYKNYEPQASDEFTYTITNKDGYSVKNLFAVEFDKDRTAHIRAVKPDQLDSKGQYFFTLNTIVYDNQGRAIQIPCSAARFSVKKTALNLRLAQSRITLNAEFLDKTAIPITCSAKGYSLESVDIQVLDESGKTLAPGEHLNVFFEGGKLHVETLPNKDYEVSGQTYTILVKAPGDHKPVTLTVKTVYTWVGVDHKVSGSADVIHPKSGGITVTPTVRNLLDTESVQYTPQVVILNDGYPQNCSQDFSIYPQKDGTFKIYPKETADTSLQYYVILNPSVVDRYGNHCGLGDIYRPITVKMGRAKVAADCKQVTLYAKDKYSSGIIALSSTDLTQTNVDRVEVKKDKNPETFSAQALGGGKFAIGFVEGAMPPAKPAKITLEIYLKGNHTDKPNATVPLTVNIVY